MSDLLPSRRAALSRFTCFLSYIEDYWNDLDFTLVVLWILNLFFSLNLSALRTFRVFRLLGKTAGNPGMRAASRRAARNNCVLRKI